MASVLQPWVQDLSLMQQSVLLSAVRGPDGISKYSPVKFLLRWYRRCILVSAFDGEIITDPIDVRGGSFTGPSILRENLKTKGPDYNTTWELPMRQLVNKFLQEIDSYPHHFTMHFIHASEIIGYTYPDERIRNWWHGFYITLVKDFHLQPETKEAMMKRLGDNRSDWLAANNEATTT